MATQKHHDHERMWPSRRAEELMQEAKVATPIVFFFCFCDMGGRGDCAFWPYYDQEVKPAHGDFC